MLRKRQITKKNTKVGKYKATAKKVTRSCVGILEETTQTEHSKRNQFLQNASKKKNIGIKSQTLGNKTMNKYKDNDQPVFSMTTRHVNHEKPNFLKKSKSIHIPEKNLSTSRDLQASNNFLLL